MRRVNSPTTSKQTNIYKSSTMLKKVNPQQTVLSNPMLQSKKQLNSIRSQQLLRSVSNKQQQDRKIIDNVILNGKQIQQVEVTDSFLREPNIDRVLNNRNQIYENSKKEQKAYIFQNQDQYIGQWSYDEKQLKQQPHGYGCYKFKRQMLQYRGFFHQGLMHGTGLLHRLVSKGKPEIIYDGQWMYGQKNGTGKYYYDENLYYQGNWNKNRKQGKGRFKSPQGEYDGLWLNDKKNGKGILKLNNGTIYEGIWQNDEFLNGQIRYSNGDIYKGQSNERFERHLHGQYTNGSKQQTYKGTWRNNKKQGQGQINYNVNGQKYTGQLRNDIREGNNCMYEWKNGTKVICSFENNFPSKGKLIMPDNSSFEFQINHAVPSRK